MLRQARNQLQQSVEKLHAWIIARSGAVQVLMEFERPRKYWSDLKAKLRKEGSAVSEKIGQLEMRSGDGKASHTPPI